MFGCMQYSIIQQALRMSITIFHLVLDLIRCSVLFDLRIEDSFPLTYLYLILLTSKMQAKYKHFPPTPPSVMFGVSRDLLVITSSSQMKPYFQGTFTSPMCKRGLNKEIFTVNRGPAIRWSCGCFRGNKVFEST